VDCIESEHKIPEKGQNSIAYVKTNGQLRLLDEQCHGICEFPHSTCVQKRYTHLFPQNSRASCSDGHSLSHKTKLEMRMLVLDMLHDSNAILHKANSLKEKCELAFQEEEK